MSLNDRLKKVTAIGADKKITLRIPESKANVLDILAKNYGTNTSTLIREMIDDSSMKLQKDLIVLPDEMGLKITSDGKEKLITYFPDIVAVLTNDAYPYSFDLKDCNCDEKLLDATVIEDARLSVEKGIAMSNSGVAPISRKEFHFDKGKIK